MLRTVLNTRPLFKNNSYINVLGGEFYVNGSTVNSVTFTAFSDDSIDGDTNNDNDLGNEESVPVKRDWRAIKYKNNAEGNIYNANIYYAVDMSDSGAAAIYIRSLIRYYY